MRVCHGAGSCSSKTNIRPQLWPAQAASASHPGDHAGDEAAGEQVLEGKQWAVHPPSHGPAAVLLHKKLLLGAQHLQQRQQPGGPRRRRRRRTGPGGMYRGPHEHRMNMFPALTAQVALEPAGKRAKTAELLGGAPGLLVALSLLNETQVAMTHSPG